MTLEAPDHAAFGAVVTDAIETDAETDTSAEDEIGTPRQRGRKSAAALRLVPDAKLQRPKAPDQ